MFLLIDYDICGLKGYIQTLNTLPKIVLSYEVMTKSPVDQCNKCLVNGSSFYF